MFRARKLDGCGDHDDFLQKGIDCVLQPSSFFALFFHGCDVEFELNPVHLLGVDIRNFLAEVRKTLVVSLYFFPEMFDTLHSLGKTRNTGGGVRGLLEAAGGGVSEG